MFKRNDGKGVNALQNRFTALLKTALRNRKIDYITEQGKRYGKEFPLVDYVGLAGDEYDFIQAIIDYDVFKTVLKSLSDREKKIIVAHILEDKGFAEIYRLVCENGMVINDAVNRKTHLGPTISDNEIFYYSKETVETDDKAFLLKIKDSVRAAVDETRFRMAVEDMRIAKSIQRAGVS